MRFLLGTALGFTSASLWCTAFAAFAKEEASADNTNTTAPAGYKDKTWGTKWNDDWHTAKIDRAQFPENSRIFTRQLVLVRHGQYENERISDDTIRRLTKLGHDQAHETGKYLRRVLSAKVLPEIFEQIVFHSVAVSDLQRAQQTADDIVAELGSDHVLSSIVADPSLKEKYPCQCQPVWTKEGPDAAEQHEAETAFLEHCYPPTGPQDSMHLLVGHGNMIRYFVCRALQVPPEAWLRIAIPHASITVLDFRSSGTVSCTTMGAASHLPPHMQTYSNVR